MVIKYNAPVSLTFSFVAFLALILNFVTGGLSNNALFSVHASPEFGDPLFYLRLFTHVLGHKDWSHLLGNLAFILLLGPILEEKHGSLNVLAMVALTALCTGALHVILTGLGVNGAGHPSLLGASGVVFMFILLASFTNFQGGEIPLSFLLIVAIYLTQEIFSAFQPDNISHFAHLIGGGCGAVFGFLLAAPRKA